MRFPRSVSDLVDQDYLTRLSPAERAWLEKFNDEFYNGHFSDEPIHAEGERKALYLDKDRRNVDLFGRGLRRGGIAAELALESGADGLGIGDGWTTAREHFLDSKDYREALGEFRALLPTDYRKTARVTAEFRAKRENLQRITGAFAPLGGERAPVNPGAYNKMATTRLGKLQETHRIVMHLGAVLVCHQFTGAECESAVAMFQWLDEYRRKVEEKITGLGGKVSANGE